MSMSILMSSMQTFVFVILIAYATLPVTSLNLYAERATKDRHSVNFPWVGVLRVRPHGKINEAITGIIMIARRWAMGNANEIYQINKKELRNITQATFNRPDGVPWHCNVVYFIVHPEFHNVTLNTIALIKLKYKLQHFPWRIIKWPLGRINNPLDVYAIGFSDQNKILEQVKYKMDYVNEADCKEFYRIEQLDMKSMWPVNFSCYKREYSKRTCVYDAGMALATNNSGSWTLLGISTLGPGCSLPSRFIDFYPYVPWIESKTINRTRGTDGRRAQGMIRIWHNTDRELLHQLYTDQLALRPYVPANETVYGTCKEGEGELVYRDRNAIEVEDQKTKNYGVAVFALTIYDLFYRDFTCIMLTAYCVRKSKVKVWFNWGFIQDDVERYTKRVPYRMFRDRTPKPRVHTVFSRWQDYEDISTTWLEVKFEFHEYGYLEVKIYGKPTTTTTPTTSTTTSAPLSKRPTRSYSTRWRTSPPPTTQRIVHMYDTTPRGKPPGPGDYDYFDYGQHPTPSGWWWWFG